jgi:putative phosphoribosyl transferase
MFEDRRDAARRLARRLGAYRRRGSVVVGLPRGGVVVADEIAQTLNLPLDVLVVRKLRAPTNPEFGIGAVVAGSAPEVALDDAAIAGLRVPPEYVRAEVSSQLAEARLREALVREGCSPVALAGRTVVIVDDGIATGCTMAAALVAIRRARPERVVVAVPVAAPDALGRVASLADELVCLRTPRRFDTVGSFYRDFADVSEGEMIALIARARASPRKDDRETASSRISWRSRSRPLPSAPRRVVGSARCSATETGRPI